jgi:glycosyltransferase involved in cell wall biosynthesis
MGSKSSPPVSIVTPVYNNADDLPECIESVLAQTYQNWDHTIVNNCSTDASRDVARRYASKDRRIRVLDNHQFLPSVPNHNLALRQISPESKYCKVVFADDWIFPRCIEGMVAVAEEHPTVGIVGAYGLANDEAGAWRRSMVMWTGLPYPSRLVSGREICRRTFLEDINVFGPSTSHLYRSDLVRSHSPFFNESNFHADFEACVLLLKTCDFAFVHEVLTFTRQRPGSLATMAIDMQMNFGCQLQTLVTHGPDFLTEEEFEHCKDRLLRRYYNCLAVNFMRFRHEKKFWDFHKRKLDETVGFSRSRLTRAVLARLCKALLNPYETFEKLRSSAAASAGAGASKKVDTSQLAMHANEFQ